jgi:hypothetical protein
MQVIEGAPPAEYGDKDSLIVVVNTRSGLGVTQPHGDVTASYGTFGTSNESADLAYGGQTWGNFISVNGLTERTHTKHSARLSKLSTFPFNGLCLTRTLSERF